MPAFGTILDFAVGIGMKSKVEKYASALWALNEKGLLKDLDCKEPVKDFIRRASEDANYHASAHYRSRKVAEELKEMVFRSASAYHKYCSKVFSHEHVVPVESVYQMILDANSEEDIRRILDRFSIRATITREENHLLSRSAMPSEFYESGNPLHGEPLARYIKAGIHDNLVPLEEANSWW